MSSIVLETERLVLRRLNFGDLDDLAALYADPDVMRYFPAVRTRDETEAKLRLMIEEYDVRPGAGLWATIFKADNAFIGRCGLLLQNIDGVQEWEVGYMLRAAYWGRGLATEAARAIRDHGFRALPEAPCLISLIRPENRQSERVAERNGMRPVREIVHANLVHRVWAITRHEWENTASTL